MLHHSSEQTLIVLGNHATEILPISGERLLAQLNKKRIHSVIDEICSCTEEFRRGYASENAAVPTLTRKHSECVQSEVTAGLRSGRNAPDGVEDGEYGVAGGVAPVTRILGGEGGSIRKGR